MAGMPPQVRVALAQQPFLSPTNRHQLAELADRVYKSVEADRPQREAYAAEDLHQVAVQAAVQVAAAQKAMHQPDNIEVAAVSKPREDGDGAKASGGTKPKDRRRRSGSGFPWDDEKGICGKHAAFGVNAKSCSDPARCPMADMVKPDQN